MKKKSKKIEVKKVIKQPQFFTVECTYKMRGSYYVEAESLKEAIDLVVEANYPYDKLPDNSRYVDDTFEVNSKK